LANRNYVKGYQFERRVRSYFENKGFFVIRSAGSKGIFDIIAINKKHVVGVQCKVDGRITKAQANSIAQIGKEFGILPILAYRDGKKLLFRDLTSEVVTDDIHLLLNGGV